MKILTIAVAAYNVSRYLRACLESLLVDETHRHLLEVIITDDGSSDDSADIAEEFVNLYPDVFVLHHQANAGYGTTVNYALAHASGRFFKLCDGDDLCDTHNLEKLLDFLATTDCEIVVNDYAQVRAGTAHRRHTFAFAHWPAHQSLPVSQLHPPAVYLPMQTLTFATSVLRAHWQDLPARTCYTDALYTLTGLSAAATFAYVPGVVYLYSTGRRHQSTARAQLVAHYADQYRMLKILLARFGRFAARREPDFLTTQLVHCATAPYLINVYYDPDPVRATRRLQSFDRYLRDNFPALRAAVLAKLPSLKLAAAYRFNRQWLDASWLWQMNSWRQKRTGVL